MFTAEQFRTKAAECAELLRNTVVPSEMRKHQQSKDSFSLLADNEDWMADNFDKIIRSHDIAPQENVASPPQEVAETPVEGSTIAAIEEHILHCLGAAVIMQWKTIPTKLQRELFDTAGSLGDVLQTTALRGQIARFLHSHKDDEKSAGCAAETALPKG
jgi:hypothetical protein